MMTRKKKDVAVVASYQQKTFSFKDDSLIKGRDFAWLLPNWHDIQKEVLGIG